MQGIIGNVWDCIPHSAPNNHSTEIGESLLFACPAFCCRSLRKLFLPDSIRRSGFPWCAPVMAALSCGVPVIGYKSFENLNEITGSEGAITLVDNAEQLDKVLPEVIKKKSDHSLLEKTGSWGDVAQSVLRMVREENA